MASLAALLLVLAVAVVSVVMGPQVWLMEHLLADMETYRVHVSTHTSTT
jgi:hypothetical protein